MRGTPTLFHHVHCWCLTATFATLLCASIFEQKQPSGLLEKQNHYKERQQTEIRAINLSRSTDLLPSRKEFIHKELRSYSVLSLRVTFSLFSFCFLESWLSGSESLQFGFTGRWVHAAGLQSCGLRCIPVEIFLMSPELGQCLQCEPTRPAA